MNNNTTSQYMDKQIMDLSNSQSPATTHNNSNSNNDFIDFMNRPPEKKDDIVPSYDFMPIRPAMGSSSRRPLGRRILILVTTMLPSGRGILLIPKPASLHSEYFAKPIFSLSLTFFNYSSLDADEPAKFVLGKNHKPSNVPLDVVLVSEIDRTMKKYMDNLMHAVDNMSARLSQLETRTRNLENSIDDLKVSVDNSHGTTDGKMRLLENILTEVRTGIQVIRDKQEIVEAQLQIAKLQVPKVEQVESKNTAHPDSMQTGVSAHQQFSTVSPTQPPPTLPPPNAPPPPPQQNLQPQVQLPNQFPQNQVHSVPQRDSYFPSPGQTPENPSQQYQIPPPQQQHPAPSLPQHQYQSPPQPQYSQPPPPSQPHPSFSAVNPSLPQPPIGHLPEDTQYISSPPSQQYYGPTPNVYEPPSSRPGPGYSGSFGPSSGHGEPYPYSSSPSQYGSSSPVKPQQLSSPGIGQTGGSGYPQLPTARILPQALPTASALDGGSGSGSGSGNRVPIDDVVDRVTNMGFSRDQVRATVRKLTENGQAVDLNVVLDKLMNDGGGQAPRGWFGR
ncbi:hypothetical protein Pfo_030223 [Paulownia fortunei]|nr:hypothetical protein Pfo_030223 [Paulownia fortunei]